MATPAIQGDRSPVDLVLTPDEKWLLTANQTSDSVSLVRIADGAVVAEVACGKHPSAIALSPDGRRVLVSGTYSGELCVFALEGESLRPAARFVWALSRAVSRSRPTDAWPMSR